MKNQDKKHGKKSSTENPVKVPIPEDLIDDIKKNKIDPLTEGKTNLGYEEKPPRKKELEQKEHYDQPDK
ncbi:hypothetical protein [Flavobacterium faecale]|uniref:hypothetical protein n=1 Tax=Flavobacterium faecale TaxID=1355330 RepID=UPI003AAACFF0